MAKAISAKLMKLNFKVQLYDEVHLMNYEFLGKIPVRTRNKFIKNLDKVCYMTQFVIECRCSRHSVTKKFKTILQMLPAKPKLWKKLFFFYK